ncbi:hypothetical protein FSARC_11962 [Fusarium sarcochroum]|uniref:Guanine nucleotide exchange factor synembryn n=1 Tax=Fusarium sarcochroum TaxID=1208366 RepID=A0A8H4TBZ5_9HYPO|nr:hypothetical protein FSARC_11962 [Fusarium sarcochroum]
MSQQQPSTPPTGPEKLKIVTELVEQLTAAVKDIILLPDGKLKVYSRDPKYAEPLFTAKAASMLLFHGYISPCARTARAAKRVLANVMLLKEDLRQVFVDEKYAPYACKELKSGNYDDEFLNSRILFLMTYGTTIDLKELLEEHKLADRIIDNLARHAKDVGSYKVGTDTMQDMALTETVKLLFNVTHFRPEQASLFAPAIPHLATLLFIDNVSQSRPLDPPVGFIINGFLNLELGTGKAQEAIHPKKTPEKIVSRLIDILDATIGMCPEKHLDAVVTPLVGLLNKIHEHAPDSSKKYIRDKLLPTAEDRENVLGKGDTLSAKLLKNSTNAMAPALRDAISHLLFDMSDRDASKYVENVGYGFASGFLFQNNIPVPASASEAFSTGDAAGSQKEVNPITGQFVDAEKPVEEPDMTEEEKEREAERLYVLFERLKQTGINVQNPVEAAINEGRFRELGDDEVEELD